MQFVEIFSMTSWSFWFAVGAILLIVEVLVPTFLALGFGIGAWCVSALIAFVLPPDWISAQFMIVLWAALSALTWMVFRIAFKNRFSGNEADDGDINEY